MEIIVGFGSNVTILEGVTIGDNVVIGAGTVVSKSIMSDSVVIDKTALVIKPYSTYTREDTNNIGE